jgi:hypothetical protein
VEKVRKETAKNPSAGKKIPTLFKKKLCWNGVI